MCTSGCERLAHDGIAAEGPCEGVGDGAGVRAGGRELPATSSLSHEERASLLLREPEEQSCVLRALRAEDGSDLVWPKEAHGKWSTASTA